MYRYILQCRNLMLSYFNISISISMLGKYLSFLLASSSLLMTTGWARFACVSVVFAKHRNSVATSCADDSFTEGLRLMHVSCISASVFDAMATWHSGTSLKLEGEGGGRGGWKTNI